MLLPDALHEFARPPADIGAASRDAGRSGLCKTQPFPSPQAT
ncbi:hypothetical protein RGUI_0643 [Rhodovulum sp. P5]|nr:hypothetical protein RGUI_0643 [Rhodovulum sp. P5]